VDERRNEAAGCSVDVEGDVEAGAGLEVVEGGGDEGDGLVVLWVSTESSAGRISS
jgi:hypothetical protein